MEENKEYYYKAFISYRHHPQDIAVAEEIHKRIENFPIPGAIKKKYGIKRIGRVFRDKEELSSTGDLNDTIKNALENSEYLILMCSTHSVNAKWVLREVEYFLESHDRRHILTVLIDGEDPYDVIPKLICEETVRTQAEDGTFVDVKMNLEPLSCDYRIDRRRARADELPRLAAALIGCRYSELKQRQRQRQMRLMGLAGAAMAALSLYFMWSNIQIQKNYREALINQSRNLATTSDTLYHDSDRMMAAQVALAALPKEGEDKPLVVEAERALAQAVNAYYAPYSLNYQASAVMHPNYGFAFRTTPDGTYGFFRDGSYTVRSWDPQTDQFPASVTFDTAVDGIAAYGSDSCLISVRNGDQSRLMCLHVPDLTTEWEMYVAHYIDSLILLDEEGENSDIAAISGSDVVIIDGKDRSIRQRYSLSSLFPGEDTGVNAHHLALSKNGRYLAAVWGTGFGYYTDNGERFGVLIIDLETGKTRTGMPDLDCYSLSNFDVGNDGAIYGLYEKQKSDITLNYWIQDSGQMNSTGGFYTGTEHLFRYDIDDDKILWDTPFQYKGSNVTGYRAIEVRYCELEDGTPIDLAVAAAADTVCAVRTDSGKIWQKDTMVGEIVAMLPARNSAVYADVLLSPGYWAIMGVDDEMVSVLSGLPEAMSSGQAVWKGKTPDGNHRLFVVANSQIYMIRGGQGDPEWKVFDHSAQGEDYEFGGTSVKDLCAGGPYVATLSGNGVIAVFDTEKNALLWETEKNNYSDYEGLAGFSEDGRYLYVLHRKDQKRIWRFTVADGTRTEVPFVTKAVAESEEWKGRAAYRAGGYLHAFIRNGGTTYWYRKTLEEDLPERIELQGSYDMVSWEPAFTRDGSCGLFVANGELADDSDDTLSIVDFDTGTETATDILIADGMVAWDDKGEQFFAWQKGGQEILVCSRTGSVLQRIDIGESVPVGMYVRDGELLVLFRDLQISHYRLKDGAYLGTVLLGNNAHNATSVRFTEIEGGRLFIQMDYFASVFDPESFTEAAWIDQCSGYVPEKGIVLIKGKFEGMGWCPLYSTEDIVRKGEELLEGMELTEEEKSAYGIG